MDIHTRTMEDLKKLPLETLELRYQDKKDYLSNHLGDYEIASGPDWNELFELRREIDRRYGEKNPLSNVNFNDYLTD